MRAMLLAAGVLLGACSQAGGTGKADLDLFATASTKTKAPDAGPPLRHALPAATARTVREIE